MTRIALLALALLLGASGCYSPTKELAARSAIEQEVTSAALRSAVEKLDLADLERTGSYALELAAPAGSDAALARSRLEQRIAGAGLLLERETGPDTPVLRAVIPFAGADLESTLWGVPFIVPGLPVALGDISLFKSGTIRGRARVELFVARPGAAGLEQVASAEASRHYRNITFFTFIGPFRLTNLAEGPPPGREEPSFWRFWDRDGEE